MVPPRVGLGSRGGLGHHSPTVCAWLPQGGRPQSDSVQWWSPGRPRAAQVTGRPGPRADLPALPGPPQPAPTPSFPRPPPPGLLAFIFSAPASDVYNKVPLQSQLLTPNIWEPSWGEEGVVARPPLPRPALGLCFAPSTGLQGLQCLGGKGACEGPQEGPACQRGGGSPPQLRTPVGGVTQCLQGTKRQTPPVSESWLLLPMEML